MKTKLVTADKGVVSFDLPACPVCGEQPTSDLYTVMCRCGKPEDPIEYIGRCNEDAQDE